MLQRNNSHRRSHWRVRGGRFIAESLEARRLLAGWPAVNGLTLMNADSDGPIPITLGRNATVTLDLNALPTRRLNIRADVGAGARSVRFGLNANAFHRVESGAPFAFASDDRGNYFAWTPAVGTHRVTATAHASPGAGGAAGDTFVVTLRVIDTRGNTPTPPAPPAPPTPPTPPPSPTGGGTIAGRVFDDANRNGRVDGNEAGVAGRTVFVDRNYNGARDANDPSAVTAANGAYAITGVAASHAYAIRTLLPGGSSQTAPANNASVWIALGANATAANVNFGVTTTNSPVPPTTPPPSPTALSWPGSWQRAADAPAPRFEPMGHTFAGKVYAFGGFKNSSFQVDRSYTMYDPAANRWTNLGNLPAGMAESHITPVDDGRYIYFVGGFAGDLRHGQDPSQVASDKTFRYDPSTNAWTQMISLPSPQGAGGSAIVGRKLHFFGGNFEDRVTNVGRHLVLDLDAPWNGWTGRAAMSDPKDHFSTVVLAGKVYAIAGEYEHDVAFNTQSSAHVYDPAINAWSRIADLPMPSGHAEASTFVLDGHIVFAGGQTLNQAATNRVFAYSPATNRWTERTSLPGYLQGAVVSAVGNRVVVTLGATYTVAPLPFTWVGYR